jgi:Xaa-Pro aminopeptidase
MTEIAERLAELRAELERRKLDGFIIPRSDEYLGEYVPACAERLAWLSGFTGSAGTAIVLADRAIVLSDGRYTIQLRQQVDPDLFAVGDSAQIKIGAWLAEHAQGKVIGYDPKLHAAQFIRSLDEYDISLSPVSANPLDAIWIDRPAVPDTPVEIFPDEIAGRTAQEKIAGIAAGLKKEGVDCAVITAGDSIAWLLNIRARDIAHIPVALSYAVIHADESVDWFINAKRVDADVRAHLGNRISLQPVDALEAHIKNLSGRSVGYDPHRSPIWFAQRLKDAGAHVVEIKDPCVDPRATKTKAEIAAMRAAHRRDGQAVREFMQWLRGQPHDGTLDELDIEAKLKKCRASSPHYVEDSFETIAGFGAHGAIVHYRASPASAKKIDGDGLLLLDSGAQYTDGTTDITRTIAIGVPTREMKERATLVLKAHIAVASAKFPEGTSGAQIDALARRVLWDHGLDYAHGTGHGVGCYLSVHEEAASLSPRGSEPLKPGMILSNEPGYYKEGEYGIRLENLVLVTEAGLMENGRKMLAFETLTQAPFDERLIVAEMLDERERQWLAAYNAGLDDTA